MTRHLPRETPHLSQEMSDIPEDMTSSPSEIHRHGEICPSPALPKFGTCDTTEIELFT